MLVSPRDLDSWRQLCDTKTCNYPCILPGSLRLKEKRRITENSENIKKVLCFTALDAIPQSQKAHHLKRRNAETIVFYRPKMRSFSGAKMCAKRCGLRSLSRFTIRNAIAENRNRRIEAQNGNVSKPSPLSMKVTCRISKGRNEAAKTSKIAQTFG